MKFKTFIFRETSLADDQTFRALIDRITDMETEKNIEFRFTWMNMMQDFIETKIKVFSYSCFNFLTKAFR